MHVDKGAARSQQLPQQGARGAARAGDAVEVPGRAGGAIEVAEQQGGYLHVQAVQQLEEGEVEAGPQGRLAMLAQGGVDGEQQQPTGQPRPGRQQDAVGAAQCM